MFRNNENTLSFFQTDKPEKSVGHTADDKLCNKIISEVKHFGNAYCYNQKLQEKLKGMGYKVSKEGLVEK